MRFRCDMKHNRQKTEAGNARVPWFDYNPPDDSPHMSWVCYYNRRYDRLHNHWQYFRGHRSEHKIHCGWGMKPDSNRAL